MKVLVSCGSKFHSDHLARQLQERGLLYRLVTAHPFWAYRRERIDRDKTVFLFPIFAAAALLGRLLNRLLPALARSLEWWAAATFDWLVSFRVGNADCGILWAWTGWYTLRRLQRKGGIAVIEEVGTFNRYQEDLLRQEYRRLGLAFTATVHPRILEREERECRQADYIFCPSDYVAASFEAYGIPRAKIIVNPYGVDLGLFKPGTRPDGAFRILCAGSVGVRKGQVYLFEALAGLGRQRPECMLIGRVEPAFRAVFERYRHLVRHVESVPHARMPAHYAQASCFVFPSLDEGMAYVILEAMACGLPVVTTAHAGVSGIVRDGREGFIVPVRDSGALREKIDFFLNHPQECSRMGEAARERAQEFGWERYGERLARILATLRPRAGGGA